MKPFLKKNNVHVIQRTTNVNYVLSYLNLKQLDYVVDILIIASDSFFTFPIIDTVSVMEKSLPTFGFNTILSYANLSAAFTGNSLSDRLLHY